MTDGFLCSANIIRNTGQLTTYPLDDNDTFNSEKFATIEVLGV